MADLLRLGRPHFLIAGFAFVVLGIALARHAGQAVHPVDAAIALLVVACTQWGVHYGNEAHDVEADRANTRRTRLAGGSGLVVAGRVTQRDALLVCAGLFGTAIVAAGWLAWRAPVSLAATAPMLTLAWAYSAPPLRLCARGLGEAVTGLIVAVLVPATVLLPAGAEPGTGAWWPLAPLAVQIAAAVAVLSLPDADSDAGAGKRTLAVRLGPRRTRRLLQAAWLACGLASTAAIVRGAPPSFALAGGIGFAAAVVLPVLVLRRAWDPIAVVAILVAASQWALTLAWALGHKP